MVHKKQLNVITMKILSPIASMNDLKELCRTGVDEVYCGVLTEGWLAAYSNVASINRVERLSGNLKSYEELGKVTEYAHQQGVKVFLALNGLYTRTQQKLLHREIRMALSTDIDALIVADFGALYFLKEKKGEKEIHASTGLTAYNSEEIKMLKDFGVSRVALPRDLSKPEIFKIVKENPDMQFEVFIMNGRCENSDGFCTFQHGISDLDKVDSNRWLINSSLGYQMQQFLVRMPFFARKNMMALAGSKICSTACSIDYKVMCKNIGDDRNDNDKMEFACSSTIKNNNFLDNIYSCGGCHVFDFLRYGVTALKIVGRSFPQEHKVKDVLYLRGLIEFAEKKEPSVVEFQEHAKKIYRNIFGYPCKQNCYYRFE